jgi:hypothetical protein
VARGKVEEQIEALNRLRGVPPAEAAAALHRALRNRSNLVVAKAAALAAELRLDDLLPELLGAFERLFADPVERDPRCWGKNALAKALVALDHRDPAPFFRGSRHIQMEPVWGGREDAAQALRGTCLLALLDCPTLGRDELLRSLVDALAERSQPVRLEAVRALEQLGGEEAVLLLRLKARLGDAEARIAGQVFDALLRLEGEAALPLLAAVLESAEGEIRDEAAMSLGGSRFPGAFERLRETWNQTRDPRFRRVLLDAIGASRLEPAILFLVDLLKSGRPADAQDVMEALALHRDSVEIARRVEDAVEGRGPEWKERFRRLFCPRVPPQETDRNAAADAPH